MTSNPKSTRLLLAAAFCMGIAGAGSLVQAQTTNYLVDQFDDGSTINLLGNNGWGQAAPGFGWDNMQNVTTTMGPNTPGSGSAQWVISWPTTSDQVMVTRSFN